MRKAETYISNAAFATAAAAGCCVGALREMASEWARRDENMRLEACDGDTVKTVKGTLL